MLTRAYRTAFASVRHLSSGTASLYDYATVKGSWPREHVLNLQLSRPEKSNAINQGMWDDLSEAMTLAGNDPAVRSVLLSGAGKNFCAGIDLAILQSLVAHLQAQKNSGHAAYHLKSSILNMQESFNCIANCPKPVIAAIHGICLGAGVDMIAACDIRYCTDSAIFNVKEVELGITADLGTLQRLPKIMKSDSLVREWCLTARNVDAAEAREAGLVSRTFASVDELLEHATEQAARIARFSPLAVTGTKRMLNYTRDHTTADALDYVATWNMAMLQSHDVAASMQAAMTKQPAVFLGLGDTPLHNL